MVVTPAVAFAGATGSPEAVSSRVPVGVNRLVKAEFVFGGTCRSGRRRRARGRDDQPGTRLPTSCIAAAGRCTEAPQIGSANDRKGAKPEARDLAIELPLSVRKRPFARAHANDADAPGAVIPPTTIGRQGSTRRGLSALAAGSALHTPS